MRADAATEHQLLLIWSEVLGLAPASTHENFFELGGHSFLVIQVIMRVREQYGIELPFVAFLDGPTVHEQARLIDSLRSATSAG